MSEFDKVLVMGVRGEIIFLILKKNNNESGGIRIIDRKEWKNDGSSSERLLEMINTFLGKNGLDVNELSKVKVEIDEKQKYTLARIMETVANTINYCLKD